jgi:hypothetical protein
MVLNHHKLHVLERGHRLVDVPALIHEIAEGRVDHLDVGGVAAGLPPGQQVGQER